MTSKKRYFGTDGIRGTVGEGPINPMFMLRLGHAVGQVLRRKTPKPTAVIGKDTRISGYMIESALEAGIISAGVDVVLLGPLPTPGVAYITRALRADLGIVISASHNPYQDNGIKFFTAKGEKTTSEWEDDVEAQMHETENWEQSYTLGRARRLDDAAGRYIEFCKNTFDKNLSLKNLKIVVDAAHGAAYNTSEHVFHELGAEVICIACKPDGVNINHGVGATHPEFLVKEVLEHKADYGVALDGDADRILMVDRHGNQYDGDQLLYIMVKDRIIAGEAMPGAVGTVMTNMGIELAFKRQGINFVRADVGDKYILEELQKRNWSLGGESSGHILALDKHSTGDGTMAALQVLQAVARTGKTMVELVSDLTLYPRVLINVRLKEGAKWNSRALLDAQEFYTKELGDGGRVLIRPSGTEPVVRVMVEASSPDIAGMIAQVLADTMKENA